MYNFEDQIIQIRAPYYYHYQLILQGLQNVQNRFKILTFLEQINLYLSFMLQAAVGLKPSTLNRCDVMLRFDS